MFLALYSAFANRLPGAVDVLAVFGAVAALFAIGVGIAYLGLRRQLRRFNADNHQAIAALARGDLTAARAAFSSWVDLGTVAQVTALARHNLAWTMIRQGEPQQAVDLLRDNDERYARELAACGIHATSAADLGLAHALLGDLAEARAWLARADDRTGAARAPSLEGMKAFARAVIDCRSGQCAAAARALEERWTEHEGSMTGDTVRPMRVVRAFAVAGAGPREAGRAEALLATSRPAYPGEYECLGVAWPEMAQFLAAHGLTRR